MREESPPTNIDRDMQVQQSSEHDSAIQEGETMPLQAAGDSEQEAMSVVQADNTNGRASTPQEDNAVLFGGSVFLALLLVAVVSYFITRRSRGFAKQVDAERESSSPEKMKGL